MKLVVTHLLSQVPYKPRPQPGREPPRILTPPVRDQAVREAAGIVQAAYREVAGG